MKHSDTVDKIIGIYLASVCREPFMYKGKPFFPKLLIVSPLLLRGHTCPSACGACCGSFSLDFLPNERKAYEAEPRIVQIDGREVTLISDDQSNVPGPWCRNLDRLSGRCRIYDHRPMACDFELIRFLVYETKVLLIQKQYGRAWAMKRTEGGVGALCEMLPATQERIQQVIRKLDRLESWAKHFGISTRIPAIVAWIERGDHDHPLHLPPEHLA